MTARKTLPTGLVYTGGFHFPREYNQKTERNMLAQRFEQQKPRGE